MVISAGQRVYITDEKGNDILEKFGDIPLMLDSDVAITLSSTFSPFLAGLNILKGVSGIFSSVKFIRDNIGGGSFKQLGLQTWDSTEPIGLNLEIKLAMKNNAYNDVYLPALMLMKLPLPTLAKNGTGGLVPPGPTVFGAIADTAANVQTKATDKGGLGGMVQNIIAGVEDAVSSGANQVFSRGYIYGVHIGKTVWLPQIVVKRVTPVFSIKTDTNDVPIWCTLTIDIDSIYSATQESVNQFDQFKKGSVL